MSKQGARSLHDLRRQLDADGEQDRSLRVVVDGRFTSKAVLTNLPSRTTLIGRIRKDAKLYHLPELSSSRGRKRSYGERAPTPEALRQDDSVAWQRVAVWAAGKVHQMRVKTIAPLRWRAAGEKRDLRLIVIAPLGYRPRRNSRILYRQPAYLICTNPDLPIQQVLQAYIWRWDIEVNFRDEKQLIGLGQAQVRNPNSVEAVPALLVASYAMLLLAAIRAFGKHGRPDNPLPLPKWQRSDKATACRYSTAKLINHLRAELWGRGLSTNHFSSFSTYSSPVKKPEKYLPNLASAVCYTQM